MLGSCLPFQYYPNESENPIWTAVSELRATISQEKYYELDRMVEIITNDDESEWEKFRGWKSSGQSQVTLIHVAAYSGSVEMLQRAIELGASLDDKDWNKDTALYYAAVVGSVEIVRWLLHDYWDEETANAQVLHKNLTNNTALHGALQGLASHSIRNPARRNPEDTLTRRVRNLEVMRLLLDAGADANAHVASFDCDESARGSPLLSVGTMLSFVSPIDGSIWYERTVDLLISKGASVKLDEDDFRGSTILHHAAYMGCHKTIRLVVEAYEQQTGMKLDPSLINKKNEVSSNTFHMNKHKWTISIGHCGAAFEYKWTPLHQAAEYDHPECVRALIDYGASLSAENNRDESVIDCLLKNCKSAGALLEEILDARVRSVDAQSPGAIQIVKLDLAVLAPPHELQMAVVLALTNAAIASNTNAVAVLQHPLVEAFLDLTWSTGLQKIRKYSPLLCVVTPMGVLYGFALALVTHAEYELEPVTRLLQLLLLLYTIGAILSNLITFTIMPKFFLQQFENWISMIGVLAGLASQYSPLSAIPSVCILIVFISIEGVLKVGPFVEGVLWYTQLFTIVLSHVCKALVAYFWIIWCFVPTFLLLFHGQLEFRTLPASFLKSFVMMTGEYEIGNLFDGSENNIWARRFEDLLLPITIGRYVILLLFIIIVGMVIMNLITALAISDVQKLEEKGKLLRLLKLIQWRANLDSFQRKHLAEKWDEKMPGLLRINIETKVELDLISDKKRPKGISAKLRKALLDVASKNLKKFD